MKTIPKIQVTMMLLIAVTGLRISNGLSPSRQTTMPNGESILPTPITNRRLVVAGLLTPLIANVHPADAFDNGIPDMEKYKDKRKNPGTQPELGLGTNGKLQMCDDGLNCFSTSGDESHRLELWRPKTGSKNVMGELLDTIKAYPPGQARVDKGGFKIITSSPDYLYVQFESMKHGFIDDVEFAINGNEVQVRSSSRIGSLDLGVNAKRLNWISADLREKGWAALAITKEDYPDYFNTLVFTFDDYIRSILYPDYCPVPSQPLDCKQPAST